jgi:energy-coupling factor transporter transmembrane protein EcfT
MKKKRFLGAVALYSLLLLMFGILMAPNPFGLSIPWLFSVSALYGAGIMALSIFVYKY